MAFKDMTNDILEFRNRLMKLHKKEEQKNALTPQEAKKALEQVLLCKEDTTPKKDTAPIETIAKEAAQKVITSHKHKKESQKRPIFGPNSNCWKVNAGHCIACGSFTQDLKHGHCSLKCAFESRLIEQPNECLIMKNGAMWGDIQICKNTKRKYFQEIDKLYNPALQYFGTCDTKDCFNISHYTQEDRGEYSKRRGYGRKLGTSAKYTKPCNVNVLEFLNKNASKLESDTHYIYTYMVNKEDYEKAFKGRK